MIKEESLFWYRNNKGKLKFLNDSGAENGSVVKIYFPQEAGINSRPEGPEIIYPLVVLAEIEYNSNGYPSFINNRTFSEKAILVSESFLSKTVWRVRIKKDQFKRILTNKKTSELEFIECLVEMVTATQSWPELKTH